MGPDCILEELAVARISKIEPRVGQSVMLRRNTYLVYQLSKHDVG